MPERITLSRAKGWRMPPNTVSVARGPGRIWGNPHKVGEVVFGHSLSAADVVESFRAWLYAEAFEHGQTVTEFTAVLRGKNLACWCKPGDPCHADVLLELANAEGLV
jgi:hypothetical protein